MRISSVIIFISRKRKTLLWLPGHPYLSDKTRDLQDPAEALFRASARNFSIMYPHDHQVCGRWKHPQIVEEVKAELTAQNVTFGDPKQGIMIETPAAVMVSRELAKQVDFSALAPMI